MNGLRAKVDYILKHNVFVNKIFKVCGSSFFKLLGVFIPVEDKAILFSGHTRKYNDSPRAIYEYMINHPDYTDYHFIWALDDPSVSIPGPADKVVPDTWKYFTTALRCKYWITCVNIERSLHFKKKNQIYLNTGHGITIKTCGNEAVGRNDYDFSYINYFCVSGDYERDIYQRSFNLNPESIIYTGLPRNDELYHISNEEVITLRQKLNIPDDKKVILYAPTWRDSVDGGKSYVIKPPMSIDKWKEKLGDDYVLLLRAHPYTSELLGVEFDDFVRDYSDYPCINDLLKVADICVSDYSAIIFDFAVMEKPIVCFGYDYDQYKAMRGFTLDLHSECPGGVLSTEDQVLERLMSIDYKLECEKSKAFKDKYIEYGGDATEKCIKTVFG